MACLIDKLPPPLDLDNKDVTLTWNTLDPSNIESIPIVPANAYLAIVQVLRMGADVIICGRVAVASAGIGAVWYWQSWEDTDCDRLAGALFSSFHIKSSQHGYNSQVLDPHSF